MKTKLLKRIKRDWKIIKYIDPEMKGEDTINKEIFRALYKNKIVDGAWILADDPNNYRLLILGIAHNIHFDSYLGGWTTSLSNSQQSRLNKRVGGTPRQLAIRKAKQFWP